MRYIKRIELFHYALLGGENLKFNKYKIKWHVSKLREVLIETERLWHRFNGNAIKEGLCSCKLAGIYSLRNIKLD